ncbi:MAG TPA: hypothetical protein VF590_16070 [Isosphaeraceae bacterium]|jgi:hypothetical protein
MAGVKRCLMIGLLAWLGSSARAQGIVPGGWAPQFSYQGPSGPPSGFVAYDPVGPGGFGPGGPSGFGRFTAYGYDPSMAVHPPFGRPALAVPGPSGTVNATGGLIGAIRRSTRWSGR